MINLGIQKPLVSIIIPFLDREKFLAEAIESVLTQSFENWELLLVDDGSTDSSFAIAEQFAEKHPQKIRLFEHENRQWRGAGASRNLGIHYAKGDYITFLDSDDVFLPNAIEADLKGFETCPEADAVCGQIQIWYSWTSDSYKRERDFIVDLGLESEKLYFPPSMLIHNLRADGRKPGIDCIMLKRDFVNFIGGFADDFRQVGEDMVFWAKVSLNGKIYVIGDCLAKYRQHKDSTYTRFIANGDLTSSWEIFLKWLENYLIEKKVDNEDVRQSLHSFRRELRHPKKFGKLKEIYRRILPTYIRSRIRDRIISRRIGRKS